MTAPALVDDATLARGVAAGDAAALAAIYDRYCGQLLGFCQNMLRRPADAEDCLQDVFVIAATRLGDLREPERLRSWLYSVARHECLARLDRSNREFLMDDVPDRPSADTEQPGSVAIDDELAALLQDMSAGLTDRDRLLLELADRQQLTGDELAGALGVPRATAYTLVGRARTTARNSIGALLVARTGRQDCPELDALLTGWDGQLTTLRRKQIARHIDKCDVCAERRRRVATPLALLGEGTAFAADLVALRMRILSAATGAMVTAPTNGPTAPATKHWTGGWPPVDPDFGRHRRRRWLVPLSVLVVLLLVGSGVVLGATTHGNKTQGSGRPAVATGPLIAPTTTTTSVEASSSATSPSATQPIVPTAAADPTGGVEATAISAPSTVSATHSAATSAVASPSTTPTPTTSPSSASSSVVDSPPPSSSSSSPPGPWTVSVITAGGGATITRDDGSTAKCKANATCQYQVEDGGSITVTPVRATFTAPESCTGTASCTITVIEDTTVTMQNRLT